MNILNVVIAKTWGGGEQYVYDICKQMNKLNKKCFVLVDERNEYLMKKYDEVSTVLTANLYTCGGLLSIKKVAEYIKRHNVHVINCHSGHALLVCLLLKKITHVPVVMFKHNALPLKTDYYHKWQLENVDAYICVSKLVYDLQTNNLETKNKFYIVHNGIDCERFSRRNNCTKANGKNFVIGYAGRLAKDKGIDVLLSAFNNILERNDRILLKIAGSDEKGYKEILKKFIHVNKLENKIELCGHIEDMESFYRSIDLFVLPSRVKESFGLAICEAMYCGVPVIATDSGAQKEIICKDYLGMIVHAGDVGELEKAIEHMIRDNDRNKYSAKITNYIQKNFSIELCVKGILNVYRCIMVGLNK